MMREKSGSEAGFSLVELSIVLVVLALLVGGVLVGRSMIRTGELRNVTKEYETYSSAVRAFIDRYNAVPGDMKDAVQIWGRADNGAVTGQCASPLTNQGTGAQTCNGDGNGYVDQYAAGGTEPFRFWQHLGSAGLIPGRYTGVAGPDGQYHHVIGENCPASQITGVGWSTSDQGAGDTPTTPWPDHMIWSQPGEEYASLWLGTEYESVHTQGPAFTPAEAKALDEKMDDGMPGTGIIHAVHYAECTGSAKTAYATAVYAIEKPGKLCALRFGNIY